MRAPGRVLIAVALIYAPVLSFLVPAGQTNKVTTLNPTFAHPRSLEAHPSLYPRGSSFLFSSLVVLRILHSVAA